MLVRLRSRTPLVLGLQNIGALFVREWPAGLLRLGGDVWIVERVRGGNQEPQRHDEHRVEEKFER
jgi:hypothetical protein